RDRLQAASLSATARSGLGSSVIFGALKAGDIDLYVDYSGTLWANQLHRTDIKPRAELVADLKTALAKDNITLLGELGFENAYALVMPKSVPTRSASTASPISSRTHRRCRLPAITNSSRGRNGR